MMRRLFAVALVVLVSGCSGNSVSGPSPTAPSTTVPTRIIGLTGALGFGTVPIGSSRSLNFNVVNSGNSPLTISSMTAPADSSGVRVYAANWTSGVIPAGAFQTVTVTFTPASATVYSGTVTVNGDQTSGVNTAPISGAGTLDGVPLFTMSGSGNNVFNLPTYIRKVQIVGTYGGNSSNFIVYIGGQLIVNDLLGTFWNLTVDNGIYATTGGQVQIQNSTGVNWSFTEVR